MLTIYKASAGSGKTYRLAYEYIKSLLGIKNPSTGTYALNRAGRPTTSNHHRSILAITFTNKATAEMKRRIVKEISRLAEVPAPGAGEHADYAPKLMKEFGCSRSELALSAANALRQLLYDYSYFNVSTIDSFFQTVLRTFAREVDRQGDFEVELRDRFAVTSGIGMMLDDVNHGNPPQAARMMRWITDFTMRRLEDAKAFNVFNRNAGLHKSLVKYVSKICDEHFKSAADATIDYLADPGRISRFATACRGTAAALAADLAKQAAALITALHDAGIARENLNNTIAAHIFDRMAEGTPLTDAQLGLSSQPAKTVVALIESATPSDVADIAFKKPFARKYGAPSEAIAAALRGIFIKARRCNTLTAICKLMDDNCENLEFLGLTWDYINRFREENNLILLSDTNDLLKRIINGAEMPFIYERLGVTLHNFLIDEFQDTSHMQWNNLRPLVANSLAANNDNLIIGDEKQSIYRFRNADSSLLGHSVAQVDFPASHRIEGDTVSENTNWRSTPGVIRFNNSLFTAMASAMHVDGFANVTQAISPKKAGLDSFIEVRVLPESDGQEGVEKPLPGVLGLMADDIRRQHDAGYEWNDIAILVRYTSEAERVVDYLMRNHPDIEVLSDEALILANSPSVKLVISVLKMIDTATPAGTDTTDPRGLHTSMTDVVMMMSRFEYHLASGMPPTDALAAALADDAGSEAIDAQLDMIRQAHPSNLVAMVETIIGCCIPEANRRRDLPFIAALQDEVINFCSSYNPSLHSFLSWWDANSARLAVTSSPTQQAVKVMTIHKAKGLEWDCVHIPFATWDVIRDGEEQWVPMAGAAAFTGAAPADIPPVMLLPMHKLLGRDGSPFADMYRHTVHEQTVDNLNLTYVALTRAARELIVHIDAASSTSGRSIASHIFTALISASDPDPASGLYVALSDFYNPGACTFSMGAPTAPVKESGKADELAVTVVTADSYPVMFRDETRELTSIADLTTANGDILLDNEPLPEEAGVDHGDTDTDTEAMVEAARRGKDLHAILSFMLVADDLDSAVGRASFMRRFSSDDAATYRSLLAEAFSSDDERIRRWFSPEARIIAESSIYLPERGMTLRPDRVVVYPDGSADVVDFKFTARHHEEHDTDTRAYMSLIRQMGYSPVRGYLWYPARATIIEL